MEGDCVVMIMTFSGRLLFRAYCSVDVGGSSLLSRTKSSTKLDLKHLTANSSHAIKVSNAL